MKDRGCAKDVCRHNFWYVQPRQLSNMHPPIEMKPETQYPEGCMCNENITEASKKPKKKVRFSDEVQIYELEKPVDFCRLGGLCSCCQKASLQSQPQNVGRPVLIYELPEPKFDDTTTNKRDFQWHDMPKREIPPWHPLIKDRWFLLDVPSINKSIYQSDFTPQVAVKEQRKPVYLAPNKEQSDPCQELTEAFTAWKKTTESPCHEESVREKLALDHQGKSCIPCLPVSNAYHDVLKIAVPVKENKNFFLCETGPSQVSKYWWKRTCCDHEDKIEPNVEDVPQELTKPTCPSYATTYRHDFVSPEKESQKSEEQYYCTQEKPETICSDSEQLASYSVFKQGGLI
ncbi:uncharacterized protein LOC118182557 isoform X2 [Stegodyphus dumicola]|uniref:uncharacterized protein LOC118182557 isoform X2 n=1 Tax=Stegodyphus dumicola TaxID=202533 RepID=UPI0015A98296|nr:uncharacterized protein LOC118182557 isoform X2 [Stegodyphus dumicola]